MVNPLRPVEGAVRTGAGAAGDLAGDLLRQASSGRGVDTDSLARSLDTLAEKDPAKAAEVRQQVDLRLSPVDRGRLADAAPPKIDLKEVSLDLGQMALDVVGIFEPTPFADLTNAGISLWRGDGLGAALSAAGAIPYIGDAAKLGKLGTWAKTVSHAVEASLANPAARRALTPALAKAADALKAIPDSVLSKLPADAQAKLRGLRTQLDTLANPVRREVGRALEASADRLGIPADRLRGVLDASPRPPVSSYMSAARQSAHLAQFDGGIVRVTSRTAVGTHGTLGPPNGFVTSLKDFRAVMAEAKGDLSIVEKRLSLTPGTLKSDDTVIALIQRKDVPDLKLPTGNEAGANDRWVPGGYTSQGTIEAVMDFPKGLSYNEIKLK